MSLKLSIGRYLGARSSENISGGGVGGNGGDKNREQ